LDDSGKPKVKAEKLTACTLSEYREGLLALFQNPSHFTSQVFKPRVEYAAAGIEDDDPIIGESSQFVPDNLSHTAFDPVAGHRLPERPGSGESKTDRLRRITRSKAERHEKAAREACPSVVGFPELRTAKDPAGFRK